MPPMLGVDFAASEAISRRETLYLHLILQASLLYLMQGLSLAYSLSPFGYHPYLVDELICDEGAVSGLGIASVVCLLRGEGLQLLG